MWGVRTWLLAVQCLVQGGQYIAAPTRPLRLSTYAVLRPIGEPGWRTVGVVLVLASLALMAVKSDRVPTPGWLWLATYSVIGALLLFLCVATLLNHGYLPATLLLPAGLCLSELDQIGRVRRRRAQNQGA
jgi:hypothetical protein